VKTKIIAIIAAITVGLVIWLAVQQHKKMVEQETNTMLRNVAYVIKIDDARSTMRMYKKMLDDNSTQHDAEEGRCKHLPSLQQKADCFGNLVRASMHNLDVFTKSDEARTDEITAETKFVEATQGPIAAASFETSVERTHPRLRRFVARPSQRQLER